MASSQHLCRGAERTCVEGCGDDRTVVQAGVRDRLPHGPPGRLAHLGGVTEG
ncbi:hypothetical protein ACQEVB_22475 [Pseudonocardia sp. CA-107938]|uniref:hypothetical protein n=1 Tax=Pseudonocardia sp. CA-107938 TaxID=3240021 RepID=UPI003D8BEBC7